MKNHSNFLAYYFPLWTRSSLICDHLSPVFSAVRRSARTNIDFAPFRTAALCQTPLRSTWRRSTRLHFARLRSAPHKDCRCRPTPLRCVRLDFGSGRTRNSATLRSCLADRSVRFFALRATIAHPSGRFACASLHSWAQKSSVGEREKKKKRERRGKGISLFCQLSFSVWCS